MPKTVKTKTFKDGDVTVKLTVTDAHNVSKTRKRKSTTSNRKTTRKRRKKSRVGVSFWD